MKNYYLKLLLILLFVLSKQIYGQTPGIMDFGSSTVVIANSTDPSHDFSSNSLAVSDNDKLNGFDMSATTSGNIFLAFALNGNSAGTNVIGGPSDAILGWIGNGSASVISGTLKTDTGGEIGLSSMHFAYELAGGSSPSTFTFTGKKDGVTVGTLVLNSPSALSDITLDFTLPTTGSFVNIDEIVFIPSTPIFGGFSIDDVVIIGAVSNETPVIAGTVAGQTVNDNSTLSPFSTITTTDADGDNLSATITLDDNAKGVLSGTGLTGTGPYAIASTTPADLQAKIRALSFNPTDNRTSTSETTTFTVVIDDSVGTDTNNTTTVISNAVAPTVNDINSFTANGTYSSGENIIISVTFSENVIVTGTPQITLETGTTDRTVNYNGTGSGSNTLLFTYTVQSGDESTDLDYVATNSLTAGTSIQDTGASNATLTLATPGAANSLGNNKAIVIDGVLPSVTNVTSSTANGTYKSGDVVSIEVVFSEAVTVTGTPQITLETGSTDRTVNYASGSGTNTLTFTYTVQADDISADLDYVATNSLALNSGTVTDAAGNNAILTLPSPGAAGSLGANKALIIDGVVPSVTNVTSSTTNGTYSTGDPIVINISFSEAITVTGTPQITLETGSTDRTVNYTSGSGTNTLTFSYTVQAGDVSADLDYVATNSLALNSGTIIDTAGNNATLTLASPGAAGSLSANKALVIDAIAPTITSVTVPSNGTYITGQNLDFTVNFDKVVGISGGSITPELSITIGATVRQAVYTSGNGSSAFLFRYTVQSGDLDTDGIVVGALNAATITDGANVADLTLNSVGVTTGVLVGNPTFTWTGTTDNNWTTAGNWDLNSVPTTTANVIIPAGLTNFPTISSSVTVNSIAIASGASLIANATVTAPVTYNRNLPTTNWYLVGAPVSGETQQDVIANHTFAGGSGGNIGVAAFDNNSPTSPWTYSTLSSTGAIFPGFGVSMKLMAPGDVSITGNLITTNYDVPVNIGARNSFNLLGNPFPSYMNSATLAGSNSAIDNATFWFWDGTQYVTHNNANPIDIAPAQGFFIETNANSFVTYNTSNQSHQSSDTFMRTEPNSNFELVVENAENKKSTKVFFIDGKTSGYDYGYESKMFGGTEYDFAVFTQLATENEGDNLAIQTVSKDNTTAIPVGIIAKQGEEITFSIESINLPDGLEVYLENRNTGEFTSLSETTYKTTLSKDVNGIGDYYIHTQAKSLSTIDSTISNVSIYKSSNTEITIAGLTTEANVSISSLLGKQVVKTFINSNGVSKINLPTLSAGVYIVSLQSNIGELTKKIIIE